MAVVPIVRWLLPWMCVVLVSATLAHAMGDALERNLHELPAPVVSTTTQTRCDGACPRWVSISSVDTDSRTITVKCLVKLGHYADDALQVHFDDLNEVVSDLCTELRQENS